MEKYNNYFYFEQFVLSVLKQMCVQSKTILLTTNNYNEYKNSVINGMKGSCWYDAYAPQGFNNFKGKKVYVEIKLESRLKKYVDFAKDEDEHISLYIIGNSLRYDTFLGNNVIVWDNKEIKKWAELFPIDYYAYYEDSFLNDVEKDDSIINFKMKNYYNKEMLKTTMKQENISIALGAGVSIEYKSKNWEDLINDCKKEINSYGEIDNIDLITKKIGGTNIIIGQLVEENLKNFMHTLYTSLYSKYNGNISDEHYKNTTLMHVARLIKKVNGNKRFNVITYNYDDYLEQLLNYLNIEYSTIYSDDSYIKTGNYKKSCFRIYHPHGFLPYNIKKNEYKEYKPFIVFSESEYHNLYNNFNSWVTITQNYLYKESKFLFIGNSITDPNLRRILDNTKTKGKNHFAFMVEDDLSKKDQLIVHRHFMRIGVECIWFNNFDEIKQELVNIEKEL